MILKIVYRSYWKWLLASSALLMLNANLNHGATFKMTNAVCNSYNKSWVVISQCRLKAIQRNKTTLNIELDILHPAYLIDVRTQMQKKGNFYMPWLFDVTIDGCNYLKRPNHPFIKMIFETFKDFSTLNHTCPYNGHQTLKDFYVMPSKIPIPLPTGDYLLILSFIFSKQLTIDIKVYVTCIED